MRRLLATVLAVCLAFPPMTVGTALASIAQEKEMGDEFLREVLGKMPMIHDYEVVGYVREMGGKMVATLGPQPFTYEFFVVRDADINAFAVPGGKLFANAGLIFRVESDDALAGVLGHEIAHAAGHHMVRQQEKGAAASYASIAGLLLGIINPALALGALAAGQAAQLKYQRDFEREADYLGIGYAREAGYDPAAMMTLLQQLNADYQRNPTQMPPYFLTHPLTGERLTNLEAVLNRREWDPSKSKISYELLRAQAISRAYSQTREQVVPYYERQLAKATPAQRPLALELMGIVFSHGEEYGSAEKFLREAEAEGRDVDRELGRTAFRRGHLVEARTRLGRVIAKSPKDWDTLADLGSIDIAEGKDAAAAEKLQRSVDLEPYRIDVVRALGRALGKSNQQGEGFYWFGRVSELQGDNYQAIAYYKRSLESLPRGTDAAGQRAELLRKDIVARSDELGEKLDKQAAEDKKTGQKRGPGGEPIGAPPRQ